MAILQLKRGTETNVSTYTGPKGEVVADITNFAPVIQDGLKEGGYPLKIMGPKTPYVIFPAYETEVTVTPVFQASPFEGNGMHISTQWQVSEFADFSVIAYDSGELTDSLITFDLATTADSLDADLAYYCRVRFKDGVGTWSDWSPQRAFFTKSASFVDYGTVVSFGDQANRSLGRNITAFADGGYAGIVYNAANYHYYLRIVNADMTFVDTELGTTLSIANVQSNKADDLIVVTSEAKTVAYIFKKVNGVWTRMTDLSTPESKTIYNHSILHDGEVIATQHRTGGANSAGHVVFSKWNGSGYSFVGQYDVPVDHYSYRGQVRSYNDYFGVLIRNTTTATYSEYFITADINGVHSLHSTIPQWGNNYRGQGALVDTANGIYHYSSNSNYDIIVRKWSGSSWSLINSAQPPEGYNFYTTDGGSIYIDQSGTLAACEVYSSTHGPAIAVYDIAADGSLQLNAVVKENELNLDFTNSNQMVYCFDFVSPSEFYIGRYNTTTPEAPYSNAGVIFSYSKI